MCHACIGDADTLDNPCNNCIRKKTFSYKDYRDDSGAYVNPEGPMDAFCDFVLTNPSCRNRIVFAHNG